MKKIILLLLLSFSILSIQAQKDHSRAETLLYQAIAAEGNGATLEQMSALYEQILQIDPEYPNIYYAWAVSLGTRAKEKDDEQLYRQSFEKLEKALEIDSAYIGAYHLWGIYLAELANSKKDSELFEESIEKLRKATELKPDYIESYCLLGGFMAEYAKFKDHDPSLYKQSFEIFQKSEEIQPGYDNTNILWASALTQLADTNNDISLYKESIKKYEKVIDNGINLLDANNGKGYSYLRLGKAEKNLHKYKSQIESSFHQAEQLNSQSAAYNLACYYSLIKENDKAILWLERSINRNYHMKMSVLTKDRIEKDEDFDNIRKDKRYKKLLNQYFK
ncbi:MAG: hypothetical protein E6767_11770 [Dysgonomonas sp.]|nr:hypothetical protein [Dysgonomonas sp.]